MVRERPRMSMVLGHVGDIGESDWRDPTSRLRE
jgi:hypothetical protein